MRLGSTGRHSYNALVHFWLLAELSYAFGGDIDMAFSPAKDNTDPRVFDSVSLPALQPSGLINRLAFAVSF